MAFGKNIALAGARAEKTMSQHGLDAAPQDPEGASPQSPATSSSRPASASPPSPAPSPAASSSRPAFGRPPSAAVAPPSSPGAPARPALGRPQPPSRPAPGPVSQGTRPPRAVMPARPSVPAATPSPVSAPAPQARQAFNAPQAFDDTARQSAPQTQVSDLFTGYTKMIAEESRRSDGLSLRLERLIDEVSDFQGYSDEHRENAKKRALDDPAAWEKKLSTYYINTIRPARANTAQTLEEARAKNPGQVVYVLVNQGKPSIQAFPYDSPRAKEEAVLDGATVETVFSSRTPFPPPRVVFGAADAKQQLDASAVDEAFGDSTAPARPPRP